MGCELLAVRQESDKSSVLNFYRKAIQLRKEHPVLVYGDFQDLAPDHAQIFAYERWDENQTYLVVHNYSSEALEFEVEGLAVADMSFLVGNYEDALELDSNSKIKLRPWESVVYHGR